MVIYHKEKAVVSTTAFCIFLMWILSLHGNSTHERFVESATTKIYLQKNIPFEFHNFCKDIKKINDTTKTIFFFTFVSLKSNTMNIKRTGFLVAALFFTYMASASTLDTLSVWSTSMNKGIKTIVIAPDDAKTKGSPAYPVLYLLHGHDGSESSWLSIRPNLPEMVQRDSIIVVCPDGENSWYWDQPNDTTMRYETFVASELLNWVDAHYNTLADRRGRAITGLSMGGHGAMWLSIRHKDRFGACGSISGGVDLRPFADKWNLNLALGELTGNEACWDAHTVMPLVDSLNNGDLEMIIDCGYDDFFFGVNQALHDRLMERKIGHDYMVRPGGHTVPYWRNAINYQWIFFRNFFRQKQ